MSLFRGFQKIIGSQGRLALVSERLREIEREIDEHYRSNVLVRETTFGSAALHYLKVCEEQYVAALLGIGDRTQSEMDAMADTIINRSKPALQWLLRDCEQSSNEDFGYQDPLLGHATELASLADEYLTFESAFTYATADYVELELQGNRIVTSGAIRSDAVYDAYDRLQDYRKHQELEHGEPNFLNILAETFKLTHTSFSYAFSPRLVAEALEFLRPMLDKRFSLPVEWTFPEFDLSQFGKVAKVIWVLAFIHLQARQMAIKVGCHAMGIENSVLLMRREELIARVRRYSSVEVGAVDAIIDHLTFGKYGQNSPDPALQPLIDLDGETIALSPCIICNSSIERNLTVLLNRVPDAQRIYSVLNRQRESIMRSKLIDDLNPLEFEFWNGTLREWNGCGEIDFAVVSRKEKTCLIAELKSFIAPAEPKEIINRSEEIAKGVEQITCRREKYQNLPVPLLQALNVTEDFSFTWAVISENSIGANYVQKPDVPVVNRNHLTQALAEHRSLSHVCRWLDARTYLPVRGADFVDLTMEATIGAFTLEWYGIGLQSL